MNFQKRKKLILEKVNLAGEVEIKSLAAEFAISEITIRRDLIRLAEEGLLFRTHGGATKNNPHEIPHRFLNKAAQNIAVKDKICRAAAAEINDGDIIFMDCGSTVFRLCQFIRNKKIKVITNSIPVVFELQDSAVSLNIIGGEFNAERQAVHGIIANEHINRYHTHKAFLGVDGISTNGLFANSELEAEITRAYAARSAHTFLLCDYTKIGKETYLRFAGLEVINTLITDAAMEETAGLTTGGMRIITV
jgi:DeoR family fructose operon transcriptional repressor